MARLYWIFVFIDSIVIYRLYKLTRSDKAPGHSAADVFSLASFVDTGGFAKPLSARSKQLIMRFTFTHLPHDL